MKFSPLFLSAAVLLASTSNTVLAQDEAVNCDEVCASQVAEATRAVQIEKEALQQQLDPLRAALEQAKEASVVAAADVTTLQGQLAAMEEAVAAAKAEVAARELAASEAEAASAAKLASLQTELEAAEARATKLDKTHFSLNKDLIKADIMGLLKKYGLIKDKEDGEL